MTKQKGNQFLIGKSRTDKIMTPFRAIRQQRELISIAEWCHSIGDNVREKNATGCTFSVGVAAIAMSEALVPTTRWRFTKKYNCGACDFCLDVLRNFSNGQRKRRTMVLDKWADFIRKVWGLRSKVDEQSHNRLLRFSIDGHGQIMQGLKSTGIPVVQFSKPNNRIIRDRTLLLLSLKVRLCFRAA